MCSPGTLQLGTQGGWADPRAGRTEHRKTVGMHNNANIIMDTPILNPGGFERFLADKKAVRESVIHSDPRASSHHYYTWQEEDKDLYPGGICPKYTIEYDWINNFLLTINVNLPRKPGALTPKEAREYILEDLREVGLIAKAIGYEEDDEEEECDAV
jgi:hypothetical protein